MKHLRDGDLHGKTSQSLEESVEKLERLFLYSLEELAVRTTEITAAAERHSQKPWREECRTAVTKEKGVSENKKQKLL